MADFIYETYKEKLLTNDSDVADLSTANVAVALVNSTYTSTASSTGDFFLSDVTGQVGTSVSLASKTVSGGTFDAANVNFLSVASGDTVTGFVIYVDTGTSTTSPLIAHIDSISDIITNGGDIILNFDNQGIFKI